MFRRWQNYDLLCGPLCKSGSIAIIFSPWIGDSLISMIVVNNLVRNGYAVDVYSDHIYELRQWFSWARVFPGITFDQRFCLRDYSTVLHAINTDISADLAKWHTHSAVLWYGPLYLLHKLMPDIQVALCDQKLGLSNSVRTNNIRTPADLKLRYHKMRVIIHPTSSKSYRSWPAEKFVALAELLIADGFAPSFIVAPFERKDWEWVESKGIGLPKFASLDAVARYVYESGWFIGNDSGIGHLASNLGIPTLSIFFRRKTARRWRPSWAANKVVAWFPWFLPRVVQQKIWGKCISVMRVKNDFDYFMKSID